MRFPRSSCLVLSAFSLLSNRIYRFHGETWNFSRRKVSRSQRRLTLANIMIANHANFSARPSYDLLNEEYRPDKSRFLLGTPRWYSRERNMKIETGVISFRPMIEELGQRTFARAFLW